MKKFLFLALALVSFNFCFSQFTDSTRHLISYGSTGIINKTNTSTSYVFSNALKFSIRRKHISLNSNNTWVYGWQQHHLTNNDLASALDFNVFKSTSHFYYWGLAAYDKSYSLKIRYRWQSGLGVAYSIIDRQNVFLNISDGLLYEASNLNIGDSVKNIYHTFRNSLRLRHRLVVKNNIIWEGTHFWQPSLSDGNDYIIKSTMALSVKLKSWLSVTATAVYNRVNRTQRESLLTTFGLTAEKYF